MEFNKLQLDCFIGDHIMILSYSMNKNMIYKVFQNKTGSIYQRI